MCDYVVLQQQFWFQMVGVSSNAEDASIPNEEMDDGINENAAATNEEVTVNQEDNTIVQDVPVLEAFDGPFDFEVVGLQMISNGRQCCNHNVYKLFDCDR